MAKRFKADIKLKSVLMRKMDKKNFTPKTVTCTSLFRERHIELIRYFNVNYKFNLVLSTDIIS